MADVNKKIILGVDVSEFQKGITRADKSLQKMTRTTQFLGNAIGATFAADQLAAFGREAIQLGLQFEGISRAFDKLPQSAEFMGRLQVATKGTVSEMELMQQSIQAINLGIDQNKLPLYFQFATKRARETGQSVEFLLNSIQTGLGRESKLIIDNLGINMLQFNQAMKEGATFVQAFEQAIQDVNNTWEDSPLAVDETERLQADWQNFKTTIGTGLIAAILETRDAFWSWISPMGAALQNLEDIKAQLDELNLQDALASGVFFAPGGDPSQTSDLLGANIASSASAPEAAPQRIKEVTAEVTRLNRQAQLIPQYFNLTSMEIKGLRPEMQTTLQLQQQWAQQVYETWQASVEFAQTMYAAGQAMGIVSNAFNAMQQQGSSFLEEFTKGISNLIKQLAIAASLSLVIAALGGGGGQGVSFITRFRKILGGLTGIPGLADGGLVTGPTLATVGEAGPEMVIPLNKLANFGQVNVVGRISGADIILATDRATKSRKLEFGY